MSDFETTLIIFNASLYDYNPLSTKNSVLKQRLERAIHFLPFHHEKNENTLDKIERFSDEMHIVFECFIVFDDFSNVLHYTYKPVKELMEKCIKLEQDVSDEIKFIVNHAEQVSPKLDAFVKIVREETNSLGQKYGRAGIEQFIKKSLGLSPQSFSLVERLHELKAEMSAILVF